MAEHQLTAKEQDIQRLIAADAHIGTKIGSLHMKDYIYARRPDSEYSSPPACDCTAVGSSHALQCNLLGTTRR
jgi:hypothetical protein